jgi:HK97 family phage prohead protease
MQHKSVPLLIKGADDDSGTFTGLASVFVNPDRHGDIVRRGAFSKSLGSGTRRYRWSGCTRLMTHAAMSAMLSRPPRPTTVRRSRAGFDLDTEFGKSAYRNTKGRRVSGLSIGYAIRKSTKTATGNELTDLDLIEVSIVARGANDRRSGRA